MNTKYKAIIFTLLAVLVKTIMTPQLKSMKTKKPKIALIESFYKTTLVRAKSMPMHSRRNFLEQSEEDLTALHNTLPQRQV